MNQPPRKPSRLRPASAHEGVTYPGLLRVAPLMSIPALLKEAGIEPDALLAEFGLSSAFFEEPDNLIPFATLGRVFERCVERTRCEHFGMLVGQHAGSSSLGTVGYLVQSAPDVRTALRKLAEHLHLTDGGALVTLSVDRPFASLGYAIVEKNVEGSDQILDAAMAIGFNILRGLCGSTWRLSGLQLAHESPARALAFKKHFGVAPTFDAEHSALIFAEEWLDRPLPSADPVLHKLMEDRARELDIMGWADLVEKIRRLLKPIAASPDCSLALVAERLGIHERTLNRRLAAEGTSFRELREDVRLESACQLLKDTRIPAYQIAEILGYSDATALSRAFRRWSGEPPVKWRHSQRLRPKQRSRGLA